MLFISYIFPTTGFSCSVYIFNATGQLVKTLVRNQLCGTSGGYRWEGLDENNNRLTTGLYFLAAEIFDLHGNVKMIRKAIILARK